MSGISGLFAIDIESDLLVMGITFNVNRIIRIVYELEILAGAFCNGRICGRIHIAYDHGVIVTLRYLQLGQ